jgi:hypothetical protein
LQIKDQDQGQDQVKEQEKLNTLLLPHHLILRGMKLIKMLNLEKNNKQRYKGEKLRNKMKPKLLEDMLIQ